MPKTIISVTDHPPKWVSITTGILSFLGGGSQMFIKSIPIADKAKVDAFYDWYMWVLSAALFIFGVLCVVLGVQPDKPDTDNP